MMMKKNLHLAIVAISIALICAVLTFFLSDRILMIVGACLIISLIISLLLLYIHSSCIEEQFAVMKNQYTSDTGALKARLQKSEELRSRYREVLTQSEQVNKEKVVATDVSDQSKYQYYTDFRNNVVVPYLTTLKNVDMPLNAQDKQTIIDATIDLAMLAIDVADAGDWSINNRVEQKLNLDVVAQKKTKSEAYNEAIIITDNPAVTPKWIRALSASLKEIVSDSCMIIYSGYKR